MNPIRIAGLGFLILSTSLAGASVPGTPREIEFRFGGGGSMPVSRTTRVVCPSGTSICRVSVEVAARAGDLGDSGAVGKFETTVPLSSVRWDEIRDSLQLAGSEKPVPDSFYFRATFPGTPTVEFMGDENASSTGQSGARRARALLQEMERGWSKLAESKPVRTLRLDCLTGDLAGELACFVDAAGVESVALPELDASRVGLRIEGSRETIPNAWTWVGKPVPGGLMPGEKATFKIRLASEATRTHLRRRPVHVFLDLSGGPKSTEWVDGTRLESGAVRLP